jgi:hypothetical protein
MGARPTGRRRTSPLTDEEKYFYYGRQRRWIFVVFLLAFLGVTFGLARLALNSAFSTN